MTKKYALTLLFVLFCCALHAQNLTFTKPVVFLKGATTDKAIDITNFNQHYFVTWKEEGQSGSIHARYLGKKMGTTFVIQQSKVPNATSGYAPVFRTTDKRIYLFWISDDGGLKYIVNTSDTGFSGATIHDLKCKQPMVFTKGISVAFANKRVVIASHSDKKDQLITAITTPDENGLLQDADITPVMGAKASDYPFVVAVNNQRLVRCSWSDAKGNGVYYSDLDPSTKSWTQPVALPNAFTKATPALYSVFDDNRLFYIWRNRKDNRLAYLESYRDTMHEAPTILPVLFATNHPVSISYIDHNNFMMGYTGIDNQLYLSYFSNYNPASWIGDLLLPQKADYSLKDIVIPGSHDAGMSVLSGAGGSEKNVINQCNTLTQTLSVKEQLNAGIRMFDLRLGVYNDQLFTKHAPSDCMEDAVAGGYGEPLDHVLYAVKAFLATNKKEFVILNFCHFCNKNKSIEDQANDIVSDLGKDMLYYNPAKKLKDTKLGDLAGKVMVLFENYSFPQYAVDSGTMADRSKAFLNYRRAYAATNNLDHLLTAEQNFFTNLQGNVHSNDLIRLDWQLTESGDGAAMVCNAFESEKTNPLLDGALLLTNAVMHNKSIISLSQIGNRYLIPKMEEWLQNGTITKENKPNILYVDAAGNWITDFCIDLNNRAIYTKQE